MRIRIRVCMYGICAALQQNDKWTTATQQDDDDGDVQNERKKTE